MNKRYLIGTIALAASSMLMPNFASAQDFPPKRPVTLFVGFAPGGAADAAARLIAKKLTENMGQNVIVENRAGAGGNIVHQQVANGVADGSVILLGSIGPMTIAPHMMKVGYEPFKDLAPISGGVNFPNMLVVNKESGYDFQSAPSASSTDVDVRIGQSVTVSGFATVPSGYTLTHRRIYRATAGVFLFVAEIPIASTSYSDSILAEDLGEELPSLTWLPPPDTLKGLINLPGGVMAGFTLKTLSFIVTNILINTNI